MALTHELKKRGTPVREWFESRLPNLKTMRADVKAAGPPNLLPPPPRSTGTVGTAFDYRLRYYFAVTPPDSFVASAGARIAARRAFGDQLQVEDQRARLVGARGMGSFERLVAYLEGWTTEFNPVGRMLGGDEESTLCRSCYALALFDECYRIGRVHPNSPLARLDATASPDEFLALAPEPAVDDLMRLSRAFFDAQTPLVESRERSLLNPTFAGSSLLHADADLIVDGCLIDVKTTTDPALDRPTAYQPIGYALLDWTDEHRIEAVGFYLSRVPALVTWRLEPLLHQMAGGDVQLTALRSEFRELVEGLRGRHRLSPGRIKATAVPRAITGLGTKR